MTRRFRRYHAVSLSSRTHGGSHILGRAQDPVTALRIRDPAAVSDTLVRLLGQGPGPADSRRFRTYLNQE